MDKKNKLSILKFIFALLLLNFACFDASAQPEKINWQTDYKQALAESRETGKPILIDFWATWCEPCRMLDKEFWIRADVAEAVKSFVPLKINYEIGRDIAKLYLVRGLPFVAVADSHGSLIASRSGYASFTLENLNLMRGEVPIDLNRLDEAFKTLESKKSDAAALLKIADYYRKNKMPVAAGRFYKLAFDAPELKFDMAKREAIQAEIGRQFVAAGDLFQAAFAFQDYLKLFSETANREFVYADLIFVYTKINRLNDAITLLDKLKADFPKSTHISEAEREVEKAKKPLVKK